MRSVPSSFWNEFVDREHPAVVAGPQPYILKRSRRKTISLIIHADGILEVRSPLRLRQVRIDEFIREKSEWIQKKIMSRPQQIQIPLPAPSEYKLLAQQTAQLTEQLMSRFAPLRPNRISIGRQKKRWGSCNGKGYIRINACLSLLPEPLAEYIIAHELCHLLHLNHSVNFRIRQRALAHYHLVEAKSPVEQQAINEFGTTKRRGLFNR
jgi:predicted metal-dependent hydrolase